MKRPKILVWDIESTGLNATFGSVLCIGYKWLGEEETHVISILDGDRRDMLDDRPLIEKFVKVFEECDYHVTWYGDRFDLKMIKSKMIKYEMKPLMPKNSVDVWKVVKRHFKLHSNRLVVWEEYLDVADHKSRIDFDAWLRAAIGDKSAMAEVKDHCERDVKVLEEVYNKIRPWTDTEPQVGLVTGDLEGCPSCGSHDIQRRGWRVAATRTYQQYQCQKCGRWFRDTRANDVAKTRNTA